MDVHQCPRCRTRFRGELITCPVDGEVLQRLQDPLLGRTIAGRYVIEDVLGSGGMGVVYRATHQAIGRDVAIKFLHARLMRDVTSRKRFLGEARAANQINHENIIDITDFGETDDGLVYLVMEYLNGRSLDQEIAGQAMAPVRALRIAVQIAAGLGRAHELDVIHRDVKPGNVFVMRRRDGTDMVKLLDFGIARFERELRITDRGTLLGTPEYIAPEQVRAGEVSPLTDLYALGCVLFEMLVGEPPFRGSMTEVLVKQLRDAPPAPSQRAATGVRVPPELDALVLKMLAKQPTERHRDAFHLMEDLRAHIERLRGAGDGSKTMPPSAAEETAHSSGHTNHARDQPGRPTLHVPFSRDDWGERVVEYRRKLNALHPDGALPGPIREAIDALEQIVPETARLRTALHGSAQELAQSQAELRATRLRIGRALDELKNDESRLARAQEAELIQLTRTEDLAARALQALLARPPIGEIAHKRGSVLSDDDALLLQGLALIIEDVRTSHTRTEQLRREHKGKSAQLDDIRFQIEQLKVRLASLNADSNTSQGAVEERVQTAELQLRGEMERLVAEAERVALYLRSRSGAEAGPPPRVATAVDQPE